MDERIRNHREKPYTMISNDAIANTGLSVGARGLYAIIQHFADKPNWELRKSHIREQCPNESQSAFERMWAELISTGYLKRTCVRRHGKFYYEYELYEVGNPDHTDPEPKKTRREKELELENEALRREIERLKGNAAEDHPPTFLGGGNTDCHNSEVGKPSHSVHKTEDIHNTYITPKPPQGACVGDSDRDKSEYDSIIEPLEELLPEDVQKDSRHIRKVGKAVKPLSIENRVTFITAASRIYDNTNSDIGCPLDYFIGILKRVIDNPERAVQKVPNRQRTGNKPTFCDFDQREYDYNELQKKLSGNG